MTCMARLELKLIDSENLYLNSSKNMLQCLAASHPTLSLSLTVPQTSDTVSGHQATTPLRYIH